MNKQADGPATATKPFRTLDLQRRGASQAGREDSGVSSNALELADRKPQQYSSQATAAALPLPICHCQQLHACSLQGCPVGQLVEMQRAALRI